MKKIRAALPILLLLATLLLLSACELFARESAPGELVVHFIDVGQADSALLLCGDAAMLIDGGNVADSRLVVAYLRQNGVETLDYVVCTHAHEDHVGGLAGVLAVFETKHVLCPGVADTKAYHDFEKYAGEQGLALERPATDSSFPLGSAVVTVLGPRADYADLNNSSLVLRIDHGDVSFLFTGDAERESETDILDAGADVRATVLKVGHHGSNSSSSYRWIYETEPLYAVISVGDRNSYGHPHEEVMSRLHDAGVRVYRTDMQGHIVCTSDGADVSFRPARNADAITNPQPSAETRYIGNMNSQKFHRESCANLPAEQNRVYFAARSEAVAAGFEPCGSCKP